MSGRRISLTSHGLHLWLFILNPFRVLYLQRKKLYGGHLLIDGRDWPFRALLQSGMQLRTDIIEVPLKVNYQLNSHFYTTAVLAPQFVLKQQVDVHIRGSREDMNFSKKDRKQLWSISGGEAINCSLWQGIQYILRQLCKGAYGNQQFQEPGFSVCSPGSIHQPGC